MLTKEKILETLKVNEGVLAAHGIVRIGLFGSFQRGEQTTKSDVDLLVEFKTGSKTFDNFIEAAYFLEDLLQRKVELVTPESISPYIKPHIMKDLTYVQITNRTTKAHT